MIVRPADAEIIPPLSDYEPFWRARIPFLFLSAGRSRVYHTPDDTPDKLDYGKIAATARWLTRFVRAARSARRAAFIDGRLDRGDARRGRRDHRRARAGSRPTPRLALRHVHELRAACDRAGNLPARRRGELAGLVEMLEARLG